MTEIQTITKVERLSHLLAYRKWFSLAFLYLAALAFLGGAYIVVHLVTTGLIKNASQITIAIIIDAVLMVLMLCLGAVTELRIHKTRIAALEEIALTETTSAPAD